RSARLRHLGDRNGAERISPVALEQDPLRPDRALALPFALLEPGFGEVAKRGRRFRGNLAATGIEFGELALEDLFRRWLVGRAEIDEAPHLHPVDDHGDAAAPPRLAPHELPGSLACHDSPSA